MKKQLLLLISIAFVFTSCNTKKNAEQNLESGDNDPPEYAALIQRAKSGESDAQFELFKKYRNAKDIENNKSKAAHWCMKAAEQGNIEALGFAYDLHDRGIGVPQDKAKALDWMIRAVKGGKKSKNLCGWIAERYERGVGTAKDSKQAIKWYEDSVDLGSSDSAYRLGEIYLKGIGVPADPKAAYDWFYRSAAEGRDGACYYIAKAYLEGNGVDKDPLLAYAWIKYGAGSYAHGLQRDAYTTKNLLEKVLTPDQQKEAIQRASKFREELGAHYRKVRKSASPQE